MQIVGCKCSLAKEIAIVLVLKRFSPNRQIIEKHVSFVVILVWLLSRLQSWLFRLLTNSAQTMKCLRCNLVNPSTTNICKRCQNSLFGNTTALSGNQGMIYHDSGFLVIENKTTLPKRCYRCNSRKIVGMKTQTLEYTPALEQALEFAVGALIPIPVPLSLVSRKKTIRLDLCFCHRHRSYHRILFKVGWGILIFSFLCFAVSMYAVDYPNGFLYSVITAV